MIVKTIRYYASVAVAAAVVLLAEVAAAAAAALPAVFVAVVVAVWRFVLVLELPHLRQDWPARVAVISLLPQDALQEVVRELLATEQV